jgi:hypothetical protein
MASRDALAAPPKHLAGRASLGGVFHEPHCVSIVLIFVIAAVVVVLAAAVIALLGGRGLRGEGRYVDAWQKSWGPGGDVDEEFKRPRDEGGLL